MDRVFAPWRLAFVSKDEKPAGCIFCAFQADADEATDRANLVLGRTAHSFAVLNKYPYTSAHLMVIPRRHTAEFSSLSAEELADLNGLLQHAEREVRAEYRPHGINLGMNLGSAAGAGIADHLHWHVVPRWGGDTNFMTAVGDTRVIVELLDETWRRLRPRFVGLAGG